MFFNPSLARQLDDLYRLYQEQKNFALDFPYLDANHEVVFTNSIARWSLWMSRGENRSVDITEMNQFIVATSFLPINHGSGSLPLWFVTSAYRVKREEERVPELDRWSSTWEQAKATHQLVCDKVLQEYL